MWLGTNSHMNLLLLLISYHPLASFNKPWLKSTVKETSRYIWRWEDKNMPAFEAFAVALSLSCSPAPFPLAVQKPCWAVAFHFLSTWKTTDLFHNFAFRTLLSRLALSYRHHGVHDLSDLIISIIRKDPKEDNCTCVRTLFCFWWSQRYKPCLKI